MQEREGLEEEEGVYGVGVWKKMSKLEVSEILA